MSTTLGFLDTAWTRARSLALAGRHAEALAALRPLLADAAPVKSAALANRLAARLHFNAEAYRTARRHLRAAIRLTPHDAEAHYELGLAWERDPRGSDRLAAKCFRRADRLAPDQPKTLAALGRSLIRTGRPGAGVRRLREARALEPSKPAILRAAAEALREAGRVHEAYRAVVRAKFLAPKCREVAHLLAACHFARASDGPRRGPVGGRAVRPQTHSRQG
jgi:protein O-GlcNAc transferase